jgi:ubiquinone biosynthesis protein Coq4|tara:strand:+ start:100 stop:843 length:744 start_codon:yes stop_codon:yes gene_type:complete
MQIVKGLKFLKAYASGRSYVNADLNLILTMVNELDKNCDKKLKEKFNKNKYSKIFYKQEDLKTTVLKNEYKKDTLGQELKTFWKNNTDDLFQKNFNISQTKGKKNIAFMKGLLNEHDLIHCVNKLDSTPLAEVSVLAFAMAKGFRWSFFYILLASVFMSFKNSFGKKAIKGSLFFKIKYMPFISVIRLIKEAYLNGRKTQWFMTIDWREYLDRPFEDVRKELNIKDFPIWEDIKPNWYQLLKSYKTE